MPDLPISGLPAATAVDPGDLVPIVQDGATKKATVEQLFPPRTDVSVVTSIVQQIVQKDATANLFFDHTSTADTWTDVPGTEVSFTLDEDSECWAMLIATAGVTLVSGSQNGGRIALCVDGEVEARFAEFDYEGYDGGEPVEGVTANAQQYVLSLDAGPHTVKMQAKFFFPMVFIGDGVSVLQRGTNWVLFALPSVRSSSVNCFSTFGLLEDGSDLLLEDGGLIILE